MNRSPLPKGAQRQRMFLFSGVILAVIAAFAGLWLATGDEKKAGSSGHIESAGSGVMASKLMKPGSENGVERNENAVSGGLRQPLQFRAKPIEAAAVLAVLGSGKQTVDERVRQLQGMRGISLSKDERESALAFLAGKEVPEGMGKASMQWLADELLTALRLQDPPWDGLAADLAKAAFQPGTDPVVRDYIMQHLGHLWEQYGAREEIERSLWKAVANSDETTPGSALIALSRGYERDQQEQSLAKVRQQALALAADPNITLAVRVTALSIAGDGGGKEVKDLAANLAKAPDTPVILRKVAERVGR